jgi:hypothetical protein
VIAIRRRMTDNFVVGAFGWGSRQRIRLLKFWLSCWFAAIQHGGGFIQWDRSTSLGSLTGSIDMQNLVICWCSRADC